MADNNLQVGAKLPAIKELASILECNQNQARSALISLAALGVIEMHPRAGSFVKRLSPNDLNTMAGLFFRFGMSGELSDIANAYSVKSILDKEIFINAAKYRTMNDLATLAENLGEQEKTITDISAYIDNDEEFHRVLAHIVRNPLLVFFQETILAMIRPYREKHLTAEGNAESYKSHLALYEAIKAQNIAAAENIAATHTLARLRHLQGVLAVAS